VADVLGILKSALEKSQQELDRLKKEKQILVESI